MKKLFVVFALLVIGGLAAAAYQQGGLLDGIKPGADGRIDVVAVFPHQDDESFWAGGTFHLLKADPRVRLHFICLTLGDKSGAGKALNITDEKQGQIRTKELQLAATVYGADELVQLDYHDQGLQAAGDAAVTARIVELLAKMDPEVVFTYGPDGVTNHIDHRATCRDAAAAFKQSTAQRLYYVTAPPWVTRMKRSKEAPAIMPTIKMDIRSVKKMKMMSLYSHATQHNFAYGMGGAMDAVKLFNYEWFVVAAENPAR